MTTATAPAADPFTATYGPDGALAKALDSLLQQAPPALLRSVTDAMVNHPRPADPTVRILCILDLHGADDSELARFRSLLRKPRVGVHTTSRPDAFWLTVPAFLAASHDAIAGVKANEWDMQQPAQSCLSCYLPLEPFASRGWTWAFHFQRDHRGRGDRHYFLFGPDGSPKDAALIVQGTNADFPGTAGAKADATIREIRLGNESSKLRSTCLEMAQRLAEGAGTLPAKIEGSVLTAAEYRQLGKILGAIGAHLGGAESVLRADDDA